MKKSFWILGFLAAFVAGNGYAVGNQDVSQPCVCEPGCHCNVYTVTADGTGVTTVHYNCIKDAGGAACEKDPVLSLSENSIAPAEGIKPQLSETINVSQQPEISKIQKKVISARAAVKPVSEAEKNSLEPAAQGDKDPVEKYKIIWDGYEYTCPCGFVSIDDMPPKCKRGNEDKCKGVVKPVSQDR